MPDYNKVILMGRITRDIETRFLPSNTAVVNIGIAVNRKWRDKQSGEQREEVTFVDCEAFGRTAEVMAEHLHKGRPVFIEGRLKFDQFQDRDGNNRSKLKVIVEQFQFIDGGDRDDNNRQQREPQRSRREEPEPTTRGRTEPDDHVPLDDDDIPF